MHAEHDAFGVGPHGHIGAAEIGRSVIEREAEALLALAAGLDDSFSRAVAAMEMVTGRIIVSGMGKSGHVARKIASTLASTGTTAFYVHPAEASHGDLGMITSDDIVLALSNSGETPELADLIAYSRRFAIPLVAIVGRQPSALANAADHVLVLPARDEACPIGLAPTVSTTVMMALGDALAMTLLERRGFSAEDFADLHPGGKLGSKLLRVDALMHRGDELPLIRLDATMSDALLEMTAKRLGCVAVVDSEGRLVGIITDGDLRRRIDAELLSWPIARIMTKGPKSIRRNALAAEALALMNTCSITVLFVIEDGIPVGAVHLHDCLRAGVA